MKPNETATERRASTTWSTHRASLEELPHPAARHAIHHEAQRRARALQTHTRTVKRLLDEGA